MVKRTFELELANSRSEWRLEEVATRHGSERVGRPRQVQRETCPIVDCARGTGRGFGDGAHEVPRSAEEGERIIILTLVLLLLL